MKARTFISTAWLPIATLLIGFGMLVWGLGDRSLWCDEIFTADVAGYSPAQTIATVAADIHPPLYFLLIGVCTKLFGTSEFALRFPSVFSAAAGLCLTWQLGKRTIGIKSARVGMIFLASSPLFIEFSRMARYYSTVLMLGVLATLLFVSAWQDDRWWKWLAYGFVCALSLYTFYLSFAAILGHGLALLLSRRVNRQLGKWLASATAAVVVFIPFLAILARQMSHAAGRNADFSRSAAGTVLAVFYSAYSFSIGETIFPWVPVAMPAVLVVLGVMAWGAYRLSGQWRTLLLAVIIPSFVLIILTVMLVSTGTPFLNAPVRGLFILPYLALLFAAGFELLPYLNWRIGVVVIVGVAWGISLFNGYTAQQFMNPIYIIPARQVAEQIAAEAGPNDVVIGEQDSGFSYYFKPIQGDSSYFEAPQRDAIIDYLSHHTVERIWLATIGRDGTRDTLPLELVNWLQANYSLVAEQGYVEQDPTYRQVKERLLRRPAYRHKFLVQRYEPGREGIN